MLYLPTGDYTPERFPQDSLNVALTYDVKMGLGFRDISRNNGDENQI